MIQDLKSKLEMYKSNAAQKDGRNKTPKIIGPDIHELMDGTVCTTEQGAYFLVERRYPAGHSHGGYTLDCLFTQNLLPLLKACGEINQAIGIQDLLFLDTETTGLAGSTGTLAFLIGVGFFEENTFILRQYFMRDYNEEYPVLMEVNRLLLRHKGLVTFNGKAFDWNLIEARFIFNRLKPALRNPLHLDLLYPSRRLWKLKLESCRLSSLEENILKIHRVDDIPGAMIPGIYFKYLDDRNARDIQKVLQHNETDILSMVSLMIRINLLLDSPLTEAEDGWELLGAGKLFEKCEDPENVMNCYHACSQSDRYPIKETALRRLAGIHKKNKNFSQAAERLESILAQFDTPNIPVMVELAKLYEHREKDIPKAMQIVRKALDASIRMGLGKSPSYTELKSRLERLQRKAIRVSK